MHELELIVPELVHAAVKVQFAFFFFVLQIKKKRDDAYEKHLQAEFFMVINAFIEENIEEKPGGKENNGFPLLITAPELTYFFAHDLSIPQDLRRLDVLGKIPFMADSFKEAMLKAGLISKESLAREKEKERREKIQSKGPSQEGIHAHHLRTDCDQCKKNSPDVEYYEHANRSLSAKWLCLECADKSWIPDETRQTAQSQHAKSGMFRRQFGKTKVLKPGTAMGTKPVNAGVRPNARAEGNSNPQNASAPQRDHNSGSRPGGGHGPRKPQGPGQRPGVPGSRGAAMPGKPRK
jgi:hypothetical protein